MVNPGITGQPRDLRQRLRAVTYNESLLDAMLMPLSGRTRAHVKSNVRKMGKNALESVSAGSTFAGGFPIIAEGLTTDFCTATASGVQMVKQLGTTASDFLDTPSRELPVLASKQRVREMLGHLLSFVEPSFLPESEVSSGATEHQVQDSLRCVGSADLDRLMREQREIR